MGQRLEGSWEPHVDLSGFFKISYTRNPFFLAI